MEDKKVSIVVPVYNVEKYIEVCVTSLRSQSYRNLEILLVDDGAKDDSPAICDRLAQADTRIRVIHKVNGGAASARNAGIDAATGDYICFVDGDDLVEAEYVSHLLRTAEAAGADISACGLYYLTQKQQVQVACEPAGCYDREDYLLEFLKSWSCSLMTTKLFRRSTIGAIRFEEGHCVDDEFFTYLVVMNCQKVAVTERPLYYYRMRSSSVMQDMTPNLERIMLDRIGYITVRYKNIAAGVPALEAEFFADTLDTLTRYWHHSKGMPEAQKRIRSWVGSHLNRLRSMDIPLRRKLGYLYCLYLKKPALAAEENSIQMDAQEYFD